MGSHVNSPTARNLVHGTLRRSELSEPDSRRMAGLLAGESWLCPKFTLDLRFVLATNDCCQQRKLFAGVVVSRVWGAVSREIVAGRLYSIHFVVLHHRYSRFDTKSRLLSSKTSELQVVTKVRILSARAMIRRRHKDFLILLLLLLPPPLLLLFHLFSD